MTNVPAAIVTNSGSAGLSTYSPEKAIVPPGSRVSAVAAGVMYSATSPQVRT